ncbi:MAG: TetR/AcrR family transcriptional regulator [Myxococcota bacterium]
MTAPKHERSARREQILDAALEVFSRRGVYATRIADIATEAGIAYGLVYHYFKNKEEILNTIFEQRWERVTERLEEASKRGRDARDRLERAAAVFIEAYSARPQVVELLLLEFSRMSKFLEPIHVEQVARAFAVVTRIIEDGQRAGQLSDRVHPSLLMMLFLGGLQLVLQCQVLGVFRPPQGFEEGGARLVVDLFLNGVSET